MQLVGAKPSFICRPFLYKSLVQGILGSLIAWAGTSLVWLYFHRKLPEIINANDMGMVAAVYAGVLVVGITFTMVSAWISVNKYLRMRNSDRIYE